MIHVEKIKVVGNSYGGSQALKKGFEITCSDINLLVGNQGCGKSTLLSLLHQNHEDVKLTLSQDVIKNGVRTGFFDTEKHNPRIQDLSAFTNLDGSSKGPGIAFGIQSHFMSHGEVLQGIVISPLLKEKRKVIFLDEPESGLSITNQFKFIDAIKIAVKNDCQLFIATHCYPLIEQFDVISLEHNRQMPGKEFISLVKSPKK